MRRVKKTEFSTMSSPELATVDEILEIVNVTTPVGFFVPVHRMSDIATTCRDALQFLEDCWQSGKELNDVQKKHLRFWLGHVLKEVGE